MKALATTALVLLYMMPASASDIRPASEAEMSSLLQGCWREKGSDSSPPQRLDMCFEAGGVLTVSAVSCSEEHACSEAVIRGSYVAAGGKLNFEYDNAFRNASCDVLIAPDRAFKILNCTEPPLDLPIHKDRSFSRLTIGASN